MRSCQWLRGLLCAVAVLVCVMACAATVRAITNVPAHITVPIVGQAEPLKIFIKAGDGQWQPAEYELKNDRIVFHLRPAELGSSDIMLLLNPPADLDIYDRNPPVLIGLKVDDRALPTKPSVHLGASNQAPQLIRVGVADSENALDLKSVEAKFDDLRVPDDAVVLQSAAPNKATISLQLRNVEYGRHRAMISVADASPQVNTLQVQVAFDRVDTTNFLLAALADVKMRTDSCFGGYESLVPLNDGFKDLNGIHCQNDVSWASVEAPGDHWVEVALPEPKTIKEVTVYWAYFGARYHTSQKVQIQVPDDGGWRTVYESPDEGHPESRCTTFAFPPVKTDKFRILQSSGGGPTNRPDIMWLAEIEAR